MDYATAWSRRYEGASSARQRRSIDQPFHCVAESITDEPPWRPHPLNTRRNEFAANASAFLSWHWLAAGKALQLFPSDSYSFRPPFAPYLLLHHFITTKLKSWSKERNFIYQCCSLYYLLYILYGVIFNLSYVRDTKVVAKFRHSEVVQKVDIVQKGVGTSTSCAAI